MPIRYFCRSHLVEILSLGKLAEKAPIGRSPRSLRNLNESFSPSAWFWCKSIDRIYHLEQVFICQARSPLALLDETRDLAHPLLDFFHHSRAALRLSRVDLLSRTAGTIEDVFIPSNQPRLLDWTLVKEAIEPATPYMRDRPWIDHTGPLLATFNVPFVVETEYKLRSAVEDWGTFVPNLTVDTSQFEGEAFWITPTNFSWNDFLVEGSRTVP